MRPVFLDTVGLLAVWDETDQWHSSAFAAWKDLQRESTLFFTTPYVLAECGNAASRRAYRAEVVQLRQRLESAGGLLHIDEELWRAAWSAYAADLPGGPGLVDQLSFAVMRRFGLREAFTNDRHFRDAGFEPLF